MYNVHCMCVREVEWQAHDIRGAGQCCMHSYPRGAFVLSAKQTHGQILDMSFHGVNYMTYTYHMELHRYILIRTYRIAWWPQKAV